MDVDQSLEQVKQPEKKAPTKKAEEPKPNSSLHDRLITAGVGLTIMAVWLIFFKTILLNIVLAALGVFLLYEMLSVTRCMKNLFVLLLSFFYAASVPFLVFPTPGLDLTLYYEFATFAYLLCMFIVYLTQHREMHFEDVSFSAFATLAIPASLSFAIRLRETFPEDGLFFFLLALGGAWLTDTSSYFVGTMFGRHKLCPEISPKKTVEGFFGGIIGSTLLCMAMGGVYSLICGLKGAPIGVSYWQMAIFGATAALAAVLGDLSASMIKRQCGAKDYGTILPGMGGGMDRFDSVLLVLPYTYFFLQLFPILSRI